MREFEGEDNETGGICNSSQLDFVAFDDHSSPLMRELLYFCQV